MSQALLSLESVTYRYPGADCPALEDVTLTVGEGELVLLVGASASGKSTLLRAAGGLVPHFHGGDFAGRAVVAGMDTRRFGPAQLAGAAASVFQDPEAQVVMTSVRSELSLPLENRALGGASVARAVEETAVALGIERLLERPVHTLSGGELQRVALGAAIVTQPRLLLLDEPTSQLDPVGGDELVWQLRRLNEQWGTAIVLAEHRIERCLAAADRVVVLEHGRVACDALPSDFIEWAARNAAELVPPAARMCALAGLRPLPVGVKDARALVRDRGLAGARGGDPPPANRPTRRGLRRRRRERDGGPPPALSIDGVWVEYEDGSGGVVEALRGLTLAVAPGETVALLGRNGAGKSTLLRVAAGIVTPRQGRVRAGGDVCLLLQTPADYFLHDSARGELPTAVADAALAELGLESVADEDPRDLSGGERQRLALGIVLAGRGVGGGASPAVVALDEPTRGLDHAHKAALARRLREFAQRGSAVIVATHDVEFAAALAERCVLLGRGELVADGRARELLAGGRYFATEVARVLGAEAGAVLAEQGAEVLRARAASAVGVPLEDASGLQAGGAALDEGGLTVSGGRP